MFSARARISLYPAEAGGLQRNQPSPTRSLMLDFIGGAGVEPTLIGAQLTTADGRPFRAGDTEVEVGVDFWAEECAEALVTLGAEFRIRYPSREVGRGRIVSVPA